MATALRSQGGAPAPSSRQIGDRAPHHFPVLKELGEVRSSDSPRDSGRATCTRAIRLSPGLRFVGNQHLGVSAVTYSDIVGDGEGILLNAPNALTGRLKYFNEPGKYGLQLEMVQAGIPLWTAVLPFSGTTQNRRWVRRWLEVVLAPAGDDGETAKAFTKALVQKYPGMIERKKRKKRSKKRN